MSQGKRVAWGAGKIFRSVYNDSMKIDYIVDSNPELWGSNILGLEVKEPEILLKEVNVEIIIFPRNDIDIISQICEMGIETCTVKSYAFFDFVQCRSFVKKGFALFSEDAILKSYITFYKKKEIKHYIDIGANHPIHGNASYLFYLAGAKGCLVEPNIEFGRVLEAYRPNDQVYVCGCAGNDDDNKSMTYYEIDGWNTRNTFVSKEADKYKNDGYKVWERRIPVHSLGYIIDTYNEQIDYISIDVEGLEYNILKEFDFDKYKVQYFSLEKSEGPILELFTENKYELIAETPSNYIFERA